MAATARLARVAKLHELAVQHFEPVGRAAQRVKDERAGLQLALERVIQDGHEAALADPLAAEHDDVELLHGHANHSGLFV